MQNEKVVIVGGGIAGLTAGIHAAKAGFSVTLIEKNDTCGGLVNSFVRDGFLFDGGTRALEGFLFPLLKGTDIELDYVHTPVSIGIEDSIILIKDAEAGIAQYRALLERLYPESIDEIGRIFKPIAKMGRFLRSVNKILGKKKGLAGFITEKLPGIGGLLANLGVLINMNVPMETYFHKVLRVTNQSLQDIILQHFFKGTPAFFALGYLYLYPDYVYARGGTGTLALVAEKRAREAGVDIHTGRSIVQVMPDEKRVIDEKGDQYRYDHLIWAADLRTLYKNLEETRIPAAARESFTTEREKILKAKGAESIFTLFLAVDEDPAYFSAKSSSHLFFTPSRKGLGAVVREEQEYILQNWDTLSRDEIYRWIERLIRLNTFEVAIPVLKDPAAAPAHQTGLIISCLFEYEVVKRAKEANWYDELKEFVANRVIALFSEGLYPGLDKKILFKIIATPLTIEEIGGSSEGSVIGWSMKEPVPITASMLKMPEAVNTAIPSVYKAGQWTLSPAGIPTAVMTGHLAVQAIRRVVKKTSGSK